MQKDSQVESIRARDRTEFVTDDKTVLKEQLEAVTAQRVAAPEAVEPKRGKGRDVGL